MECGGHSEVIRAEFARILQASKPRSFILAGAHYLRFDIQVLFRDCPELFQGLGELDHVDENGVHWRGSTNWPVIFAIARWEGRCLVLIDTFRFFFGSLESVCQSLKIKTQKLRRPKCIAENREPTAREKPYFMRYALTDADAVLGVLSWIDSIWAMEEVGPCVSIAHQAGRIFRRNHTRVAGKILGLDAPDHFGQLAGIAAYHGGRNSVRADDWPLIVPNCSMYDVRSMYPWWCSEKLPGYLCGRWIWSDTPELVGHGIYRLTGRVAKGDCWPYRLLMKADGSYLEPGELCNGEWVTGFELESALAHGLIENPRFSGYYWEQGDLDRHPFREYFSKVFEEKEKHRGTEPALYLYNKYLANSLTGKFVATIPQMKWRDGGKRQQKIRLPGLLFNSPVGAAITGGPRAYLFEQEILCQSIHAATDSLVIPPWGRKPSNIGENLGQWELECEGEFVCGRNKLYAFLGPETRSKYTGIRVVKGQKLRFFKGRRILKYATHAFQGDVFEFLRMMYSGQRKYTYKRMGQLREAQRRRGVRALTFNSFEAELKLGGKYGR